MKKKNNVSQNPCHLTSVCFDAYALSWVWWFVSEPEKRRSEFFSFCTVKCVWKTQFSQCQPAAADWKQTGGVDSVWPPSETFLSRRCLRSQADKFIMISCRVCSDLHTEKWPSRSEAWTNVAENFTRITPSLLHHPDSQSVTQGQKVQIHHCLALRI